MKLCLDESNYILQTDYCTSVTWNKSNSTKILMYNLRTNLHIKSEVINEAFVLDSIIINAILILYYKTDLEKYIYIYMYLHGSDTVVVHMYVCSRHMYVTHGSVHW